MEADFANSDALVVNINRPWLYGELFADYELDTASKDIK
jgi:hypothetical protein